ncbi:hypothetical protein MCOR13_011008 [Pyricularia oryzae]|nr:hypothetical protein MCOR13_011008 [Pyricularia oryzae]
MYCSNAGCNSLSIDQEILFLFVTDSAVGDGKVTVVFNMTDGGKTVSHSVVPKQAPILTHHPLQRIDVVVDTG